ncbi:MULTISPECIES: hypothetical protein [Cyanophyceae]|uniref:hypothetical protein n=1 Tax=Cyanophyceae TaxID=3028117 RepID=UPI001683BC6B|nr:MULTISPECIES: hypothetical protein [Cyanophyceae]MBD1919159.1 hypothetical protein [Phormidium sp. FACHB-77]MBD2028985.1 hypothetical protein [Phormidium sp. FACHB-322]MBD2054100.1 hypothetical protein [Leptolyngbya sp. FACHB-60]
MANTESDQQTQSSESSDGYNTPLDESQRHTGMYQATDAKEEAKPESGSSNTGPEGGPMQGTEKR